MSTTLGKLPRFTDEAVRACQFATHLAIAEQRPSKSSLHLLAAMLDEPGNDVAVALRRLGVDVQSLRRATHVMSLAPADEAYERPRMPWASDGKAAVDAAIAHHEQQSARAVTGLHLLLGCLLTNDGFAGPVLRQHGVTREAVERLM